MNAFEFYRGLEKANAMMKELAIQAVQELESEVIADSIDANLKGLTFEGERIDGIKPFTDWNESGEFHENLKFFSDTDIEFTSSGDGAVAVFDNFAINDKLYPTSKTLSGPTKKKITEALKYNILETVSKNK